MAVRVVTDFNQAVMADFVLKHQRNGYDYSGVVLAGIDRTVSNCTDGDLAEMREKYGPRALLAAAEKLAKHVGGALPEDARPLERDVALAALEAHVELRNGDLRKAIADGDLAALDRREILHTAAYPERIESGGIDPKAMPPNTHISKVGDYRVAEDAAEQQQAGAGAARVPSLARHARGAE